MAVPGKSKLTRWHYSIDPVAPDVLARYVSCVRAESASLRRFHAPEPNRDAVSSKQSRKHFSLCLVPGTPPKPVLLDSLVDQATLPSAPPVSPAPAARPPLPHGGQPSLWA